MRSMTFSGLLFVRTSSFPVRTSVASISTLTAIFDVLRICGRANVPPPLADERSRNSSSMSTMLRTGFFGPAITLPGAVIGLDIAAMLAQARIIALSALRVKLELDE